VTGVQTCALPILLNPCVPTRSPERTLGAWLKMGLVGTTPVRDRVLLVGDEFTPDGCRLWDHSTQEKLDKDRFRRDLGDVIAKYREVARRIGAPL